MTRTPGMSGGAEHAERSSLQAPTGVMMRADREDRQRQALAEGGGRRLGSMRADRSGRQRPSQPAPGQPRLFVSEATQRSVAGTEDARVRLLRTLWQPVVYPEAVLQLHLQPPDGGQVTPGLAFENVVDGLRADVGVSS